MHPSKEELSGFLLGKLPPNDTDAVAEHLAQCPPCQETVVGLEAHQDTLLERLQQPPPVSKAASPQVKQAIAKVAALASPPHDECSQRSADTPPSVAAVSSFLGGYNDGSISADRIPPMALDLETVVRQLTDSGIIAAETLKDFIPPKADPKTSEALVQALVKSEKLTNFQGQQVKGGKSKALKLGAYTILDKIGAGGMGQVFKAEHRKMHRLVAIKMLPHSMMKDAAAIARFEREVTAAAKLRHPNIVAADDAAEANGAHFLVMEYVEGKDLSVLVKKNGPFPIATAVNYVQQAAKGLEFAHRKGVVHRDIKPANLLLDNEGTVKILDMGLARLDSSVGSDAGPQAELTGTGTIMGTVDYMSPEQALNTKYADHRADIYSLGCSLYYLVAGKAAYDGETVMEKLMAHQNQPIPSLRGVQAEAPEQVQAVFKKMVAKKLEDRYQSMTEVVAELEKCQATLNALASSSTGVWAAPATDKDSDGSLTRQHQRLARIDNGDDPFTALEPQRKPGSKGPPWKNTKLLIAAGAAGFLFVLLGVIVIVRNKDGKEVTRLEVPDGNSVEVQPTTNVTSVDSGAGQPNKPWNTPAFQQWMMTVAALPAEQQIEAVSKKLVELNPGFDGKVTGWRMNGTPKIDGGVVTEFGFFIDNVTDISPVRALVGIKSFSCPESAQGKGILSDLSPLQQMKLTMLQCRLAKGSNLSPLRGMPLTILEIHGPQVIDLSSLQGMPLKELNCVGTQVSDLSPLRGMPLTHLYCAVTPVSDLSSLASVPTLIVLDLRGTKVTAAGAAAIHKALPNCKMIWPREGQIYGQPAATAKPLTNINDPAFQAWMKTVAALPAEQQIEAVSKKLMELNPGFDGKVAGDDGKGTAKIENGVVTEFGFLTDNVTDISPVRALAGLERLQIATPSGSGKLTNLTALHGMKLTSLDLGRCGQVSDLSALKDVPLTRLQLFGCTQVSDLSPLEGMPLTWLSVAGVQVQNLSPLRGMKLDFLNLQGTQVSELTLLQGMPLTELGLWGCGEIRDLSPLEGLKLTSLRIGNCGQVRDLSPLKGMPLTVLTCDSTKISDLSPLAGMSLNQVIFTPMNIIKGLDVIRQMKSLKTIAISDRKGDQLPPAEFWKKYDAGEFGKPATTKPITNINDPAFQVWMKSVAAMPAERQIEAVSKKLMELNPGFDGVVTGIDENGNPRGTPRIENGVVTEFGVDGDRVVDLSPVRALVGLKFLSCRGRVPGKGKVSDLSPLQGMKLMNLNCHGNQVSDLSPLHGMKLIYLTCSMTQVSDLSPLQGLPLRVLQCGSTPVFDLSPLEGLPLASLDCSATKATDLSPLKRTPLTALACQGTPVSDLSALQGKNLTTIILTPKNITKGLSAIRQMKSLTAIGVGWDNDTFPAAEFWKKYDAGEFGKPTPSKSITNVNDPTFRAWTTTVAAMPADKQVEAVSKKLMELNPGFDGKLTRTDGKGSPRIEDGMVVSLGVVADNVTDISPVRAFAGLKYLTCIGSVEGKSTLSDLSPLAGMRLTDLTCGRSPVFDLTPLEGMPLTFLDCSSTLVWNLAPLQGMPLTDLRCGSTLVADLSPLKGLRLTYLNCGSTQVSNLSPLKDMQLATVTISGTKVSDLSSLQQMPLTSLYCNGSPVSDLSPLHNCKTLKLLRVTSTKVTPSSVAALQKALPNCKIEWDDPAKPKTPRSAASGSK